MTTARSASSPEPILVPTADGARLAGSLFRPSGAPRQAVLIAGGLGIPRRFYAPFASWLAGQGHLVTSFDLRGMGRPSDAADSMALRAQRIDMLGWARLDFAAAVAHLAELTGADKITVIGHSLGAHHAGMTTASAQQRIGKLVAVASGAGYWRDWAGPSRRLAPLMLHLAVPLLTPLFGYFPGRRLGMVGDLPAGAARQWARWCRHPGFAWGAQPELVLASLAAARFPITAFSFTDDEAMTGPCTRKLLAAFGNAPSELRVVAPGDVGLATIGHVGAFRKEARGPLWNMLNAALG